MHFDKHRLHKYEIVIMMGLIILGFIMIIGSIIGIEIHRTRADHVIDTTVPASSIPTPNAPTIPSTILDINKYVIPELIAFQVYNFQSPITTL